MQEYVDGENRRRPRKNPTPFGSLEWQKSTTVVAYRPNLAKQMLTLLSQAFASVKYEGELYPLGHQIPGSIVSGSVQLNF